MSELHWIEEVRRYKGVIGDANIYAGESDGEFVLASDFDKLKSYLHDVASEVDPAGTLRELRLAQDAVKALETVREEAVDLLARYLEASDWGMWTSEDPKLNGLREIGKEVYGKHRNTGFAKARLEALKAIIKAAFDESVLKRKGE